MKKTALLTAAVLLFAFYNYGLYRWLQSGHDFADVWRAAISDWFLAITLLDMSIFSLLCLVWLWRDMRKQDWPLLRRLAILFLSLITGVVVLLVYLAFRKKTNEPG